MNRNTGLKREDIQIIRSCFYKGGLHTKNELCRKTGLSKAAAVNVLQGLLNKKEILYVSDAASTGGRRSKQYILNSEYAHIGMIMCIRRQDTYAFDLCIMNLHHKKLFEKEILSSSGSYEDLEKGLDILLEEDERIKSIVISIPGTAEHGVIQICDFHALKGTDLNLLLKRTDCWNVENDVNAGCIGFGYTHPECRQLALLYQPAEEYSGCGFLINGRLYSGSSHKAGEMRFLQDEKAGNELKKPVRGLWKDICAVQAVLDPERIGWCSDLVSSQELKTYAQNRNCPAVLEHIDNMSEYIETGLYQIGMDLLLKNEEE